MHDRKLASFFNMMLMADGFAQRFLRSAPEFGKGYQIIDIELKNGTVISDIAASNCESLHLPEEYSNLAETDIAKITVYEKDGTAHESNN